MALKAELGIPATDVSANMPGTLLIGKDGGYYRPVVTSVGKGELQFSFTPSVAGMPIPAPVIVKLPNGTDGITPHIGENGNWWIGETDTGVKAKGADGKSAYAYAQEAGYTGTEEEFAEQLSNVGAGGTASSGGGLPAVTEEDDGKFMGVVGGKWAAVELPVYDGAFEVTPSATEDQTLLTAKTYMDADIKIIKIPYSEVLNNSGGVTVNIGG